MRYPVSSPVFLVLQSLRFTALLLIHVGMDTVKLNGEGFKTHIQQGDKVKQGQFLIEFDMDFIKKNNLPVITPVLLASRYPDTPIMVKVDVVGALHCVQQVLPKQIECGDGAIIFTSGLFGIYPNSNFEYACMSSIGRGAFDVTCGAAVDLWREARKTETLPAQEEIAAMKNLVGYKHLHLDASAKVTALTLRGKFSSSTG